jgi:hypothetical protein
MEGERSPEAKGRRVTEGSGLPKARPRAVKDEGLSEPRGQRSDRTELRARNARLMLLRTMRTEEEAGLPTTTSCLP